MRIAMLAHGTRGDVQPALAIGATLQQRGHTVTMCVNADLAEWVGRTGLNVVASDLDVGRFLHSAEAREILSKGRISTLVRRVTADERLVNDSIVRATLTATEGADLVVSTLGMALRGMALSAVTGVPGVNVWFAPMASTGRWASPALPVRDLRLPWANRATFRAFESMLWKQSRGNLDDLCDHLGAPRMERPPSIDATPGLHVYSPRLVPRPDDWPSSQQIVGPALLPADVRARLSEDAVSPDLQGWLDSGEPPVFFGFGSMPIVDPRRMLADVAEVTRTIGVRGLIGAGWTAYDDVELPDHLYLERGHVDHEQVLPQCVAAVHHGGSGTTATVTRAGIPSVVVSVFLDQPFWGWRIAQSGLGSTFPFRALTRRRLGAALRRVLDDDQRARAFGALLRAENGAERAADLIEHRVTEGR